MVGVKVPMVSRGAQPGCEARHQRTDGVNKSNGPRGEREGIRTIAWGMPDVSGASAVNTCVHTSLLHSAHRAAGALGTRHSPRPCYWRARDFRQSSGMSCRETTKVCVGVIPGRCKASNLRCAIAHRGISRFRVRSFHSRPGMTTALLSDIRIGRIDLGLQGGQRGRGAQMRAQGPHAPPK